MYRLTFHAWQRIRDRNIAVEDCLAALEGRRIQRMNGLLILCDPASHVALIVEPTKRLILTAVRYRPARYRRIFSTARKAKHHD